jgi:hypothetical protein
MTVQLRGGRPDGGRQVAITPQKNTSYIRRTAESIFNETGKPHEKAKEEEDGSSVCWERLPLSPGTMSEPLPSGR